MSLDRIQSVLKRSAGAGTASQEAGSKGLRLGKLEPSFEREGRVRKQFAAPRGEHLLATIDRVARHWSSAQAVAPIGSHDGKPVPSAEQLRAHATLHDLSMRHEARPLASLLDEHFPCIALLNDGTGLLLTGRDGPSAVTIDQAEGGAVSVPVEALDGLYSGTVFYLRPRRRVAAADSPVATVGAGGTAPSAGRGTTTQPLKSARGLYRRVLDLSLTDQRQALGKLALAAGLSNLLVLALPLFTMAVYDRVIPHGAMETLWALSIGVMIALGVDLTLRFVRARFADAVALTIGLDMQARLYGQLMGAKLSDTPRSPGGLSRLAQEIDIITQAVPQLAISVTVDVPFFLLLLILLYSLGGPVVVAPLIGLAILAGIHAYAHIRSRPAIEAAAEFHRMQSNQLVETLVAMPTVKASGAAGDLMRQWERLGDDAGYESHRTRLWLSATQSGQLVVTQFVIVLTLMIGAYQVGAGLMTVGALAASTLLVGRSLTPIAQLVGHGVRLLHLEPSADVIARLMDAEQERGGESTAARRKPLSGALELASVTFAHPEAARPTLDSVSFKIERGERIALIGRIGSGKSTLLQTILRLHEPQSGAVLLDGADARQFDPDHIRRSFGYMAQDSLLFDVTLREAITLGQGTISDDDFDRAVQLSGVAAFSSGLPKGYATPVGPRGSFLSGGERQAVALARVLAMNPAALMLDEPTASMDNSLEMQLIENLRAYLGGRTLILATHRAALLALVDRVIWLDRGRVLADGPRDEVLARINGQPPQQAANPSKPVADRREGGRRQDDGDGDAAAHTQRQA